MQKWATEVRTEREILEYDPMSGRSSTAITMEKIDRVHHILIGETQLTINQITKVVNISREIVEIILYNELGMT